MNTIVIIIAITAALAIIIILSILNYKDRKRIMPPRSTDDTTLQSRMKRSQQREHL